MRRQASKRILTVLQRFGVCERGGMDEMLVDVTAEAQNRVLQGSAPSVWAAHVHSNKVCIALYGSIRNVCPAQTGFCPVGRFI